jgi:dimethylamine monooxygenase subunit A
MKNPDCPAEMTSPVFAHTPYDGSAQPFTIGLSPMAADEWIEVDEALADYLAEKDRLQLLHPDKVFVEEPDTREAQQEILDSIVAYLRAAYPAFYSFKDGRIEIKPAGRSVKLHEPDSRPLLTAARLVQEDLVIMRKGETGWRLAAASLSFPSSWSLRDKFGRPMHEIHAPVPGFSTGTRNAGLIERMFDNLQPGNPVKRYNWSIYSDGQLYHPASSGERGPNPDRAFIRVERQTLRKMPISRDILFTIRIHLDPLSALNRHPDRARLSMSLASQLSALSPEKLAYKGLTANRDALVEHLHLTAV